MFSASQCFIMDDLFDDYQGLLCCWRSTYCQRIFSFETMLHTRWDNSQWIKSILTWWSKDGLMSLIPTVICRHQCNVGPTLCNELQPLASDAIFIHVGPTQVCCLVRRCNCCWYCYCCGLPFNIILKSFHPVLGWQ